MSYLKLVSLPAALAIVAALLFMPFSLGPINTRWHLLSGEIENFAHPVVFAWLASIAFSLVRKPLAPPSIAPYVLVLMGLAVFGLATEFIQAQVGRDSSWLDFRNDMLGTVFGLLLRARAEAQKQAAPPLRIALTLAALAVVVYTVAPLAWTSTAYVYRNAQFPVMWRDDAAPYRLFSYWRANKFPGLVIEEPISDWRDYRELVITARNLQSHSVRIHLRINDRIRGRERLGFYSEPFVLAPHAEQTLRVTLEKLRAGPVPRNLDMSAITAVLVFQEAAYQPPQFHVSRIELVR